MNAGGDSPSKHSDEPAGSILHDAAGSSVDTPAASAFRGLLNLEIQARDPYEAAHLIEAWPDDKIIRLLSGLEPSQARAVLDNLPRRRRRSLIALLPAELADETWKAESYPAESVGRLMSAPLASFTPETTVRTTVQTLRGLLSRGFFSYGYVVDHQGRLLGVLVMRDLLLAGLDDQVGDVMIPDPFCLKPDMSLMEAMKVVLHRHYPDYPVCDDARRLVGVVRGETLFTAQTIEISAQAGSMVGIDKTERVATPWWSSLRMRHPWLLVNLLTGFVAGAVVSLFQETVNQIVVLAAFLPVLTSQAGNTGCQALAVTLRGLTLGELENGGGRRLLAKEALLGLCNGALVGVAAALGMLGLALSEGVEHATSLAFVVFLAMTGACVISGLCGGIVPLALRRFGTDPASASSILVTTVADVASLALLLGLATLIVM
ncbi:MAG: magnesium transporter [Candidatus Binatia bacterium]